MTKLLEEAIEAVRRLPADAQNDIARTILHLAGSEVEAEPVDPPHLAAVLEGLAQAKRGEFATDNEVEAAFRHFDR
jgi:predicted transcriptional regulator